MLDPKSIESMKRNVAKAALQYVQPNQIIGVGTGSTVKDRTGKKHSFFSCNAWCSICKQSIS